VFFEADSFVGQLTSEVAVGFVTELSSGQLLHVMLVGFVGEVSLIIRLTHKIDMFYY
jgi:hypothetical protein